MRCPHCGTAAAFEFEGPSAWLIDRFDQNQGGYESAYGYCPECARLVVLLRHGEVVAYESSHSTTYRVVSASSEEVILPRFTSRPVETEVPEGLRREFTEASAVLSASARASAALSRRILQRILREHFKISPSSLAREIDVFLSSPGIPSYLAEAVDAVRNVGNLAAHPVKDTQTGEVVDVEPGEAEWLLEAVEALFDFAYVQPQRVAERKHRLNQKLASIGKPPMKG